VLPAWFGTLVGAVSGAGLCVHAGIAWGSAIPAILGCAILGFLFALCQHRTTLLGYLLIGLFFGVNCWIITKLLVVFQLDAAWPLARDHQTSFKLCFLFGEILALTSLLVSLTQASPSQATLPKD